MKNYPFIKFAILFAAGILWGIFVPIPIYILIISICLSFLFLFVYKKYNSKTYLNIFQILLGLSIGVVIVIVNKNETHSKLSSYQKEKNVKVFGTIEEIELERSYEIAFIIKTDSIIIDNKSVQTNEKLLCRLRSDSTDRKKFYETVKPDNYVLVKGTFQQGRNIRNPGEFDYRKILYSKGVTGIINSYDSASVVILKNDFNFLKDLVFQSRKSIDKLIHQLHNNQTAGLLRGLLLADRTEIDYETKQNFINSGVIHILAVSGLHVGYILLFFIVVFGRFNIYLRSVFTIVGLLCFMVITGIPASVFRATLMSIILVIAFLSG
ncbi:MAG: ComEC family competence protein, partial [Ignavibacterium sp.]|nr:ComEC family competence protein [Ignavibacterium sp.]